MPSLASPTSLFPDGFTKVLSDYNLTADALALAGEIARLAPEDPAHGPRTLATAAILAQVGAAEGSTRIPLAGPEAGALAPIFRALDTNGEQLLQDLAHPGLRALVGGPGDARPFLLEGGWLMSQRMWSAEQALAAQVLQRLGSNLASLEDDALPQAIFRHPVNLSEEQEAAVRACLQQPLTLITGGPGTGKTSIVVSLLRALVATGLAPGRIALAAPTGKAAQRMGEALRKGLAALGTPTEGEAALATLEPATLHRLLGWHAGSRRFRHHAQNPLDADVVIVDEGSMVSLELMHQVLGATAPGARLIILGDADQLPSVEAGTAFRDLTRALLGRGTCLLTRSYRMDPADPDGRHVYQVSRRILDGDPGPLAEGEAALRERHHLAEVTGRQVEFLTADKPGIAAFLDQWLAAWITAHGGVEDLIHPFHQEAGVWRPEDLQRLERLFRAVDQDRILAPLRTAPNLRGIEDLNAHLHQAFLKRTGGGLDQQLAFSAGNPVLMRRNDYGLKLFNGDQGRVVRLDRGDGRGDHQAVVFRQEDRFAAFPLHDLRDHLDLAYALTVHQSQGSEFDRVTLVLPKDECPLLTREILYTALTRARKGVLILGDRPQFDLAVRTPQVRFSGLEQALAVP